MAVRDIFSELPIESLQNKEQGTGQILRIGTPNPERKPRAKSTNQIRKDRRTGRNFHVNRIYSYFWK